MSIFDCVAPFCTCRFFSHMGEGIYSRQLNHLVCGHFVVWSVSCSYGAYVVLVRMNAGFVSEKALGSSDKVWSLHRFCQPRFYYDFSFGFSTLSYG
uniref:Uncharacterized protein n=1 Tax=Oryza brachyantha TaxID=4533 RepID=J3M8H0_ORYBR